MQREIFSAKDLTRFVEMARDLAAQAINALRTGAEDTEASASMRTALASIDAAGAAIAAGDPTQAAQDFRNALAASNRAHAEAGGSDPTSPPPEEIALLGDLIDQAMRAIDGAEHRMENAATRHTSFGAIRTPHSERLP